MAGSALEVLSLARLRDELRLGGGDQTELLTGKIEAAVSIISGEIGRPLVDVPARMLAERQPSATAPAWFQGANVKSVVNVSYHEITQSKRDEPSGLLQGSALGRLEFCASRSHLYLIYPPLDGWPDMLGGTYLVVNLIRGYDLLPTDGGVVDAIILTARALYDGAGAESLLPQVRGWLSPWRVFT